MIKVARQTKVATAITSRSPIISIEMTDLMTPPLPVVSAAIAAREWVRTRRKRLGREITPDELVVFIKDRYDYLDQRHQLYVAEAASAPVLPFRG